MVFSLPFLIFIAIHNEYKNGVAVVIQSFTKRKITPISIGDVRKYVCLICKHVIIRNATKLIAH